MDSFTRAGFVFDVRDGGPGDGEPVILLHGFPQDNTCWDAVSPVLHRAGLRTLAPNQRGYAAQADPRGRAAYRMRELVRDVLGLLEAAGLEKAHLVGHDWGAAVAWMAAASHPERFDTLTVLSTPHPAALAWAMTHSDQMLRSWYMTAFQLPLLPERLLAPRIGEVLRRTGLPDEHADRYAARFARSESLAGPIDWYRAMPPPTIGLRKNLRRVISGFAGVVPVVADARREPAPHLVRVPTTYVWGRDDVALGRVAATRSGDYVRADYRFVEVAAGHWLPETVPSRVAAEILDRVRRSR
ncbi:MAG: alpha/beta fold hydrolase [Austwickia sp.]|nr:alpha/beta fold hydrolase [Austwickia sp.]